VSTLNEPGSEPVRANVAVAGSYSSANVDVTLDASHGPPPITSTRRSARRTAACPERATASEPVGVNVPVAGS